MCDELFEPSRPSMKYCSQACGVQSQTKQARFIGQLQARLNVAGERTAENVVIEDCRVWTSKA